MWPGEGSDGEVTVDPRPLQVAAPGGRGTVNAKASAGAGPEHHLAGWGAQCFRVSRLSRDGRKEGQTEGQAGEDQGFLGHGRESPREAQWEATRGV